MEVPELSTMSIPVVPRPTPCTLAVTWVPPTEPVVGLMETNFGVSVAPASTKLWPAGVPSGKVTFMFERVTLWTSVIVNTISPSAADFVTCATPSISRVIAEVTVENWVPVRTISHWPRVSSNLLVMD